MQTKNDHFMPRVEMDSKPGDIDMKLPILSPVNAVIWGGLIAGTLDIGTVFAYWATQDVWPAGILQAIASSLLGPAAYEGGAAAAILGFVLHFAVSFVFAGAYVAVASKLSMLITRPVLCGLAYGALAKIIMGEIVVPLSRADFGSGGTALQTAISWFIHLVLFGLPIALAASRVRPVPVRG
jgi:hypothetical protein